MYKIYSACYDAYSFLSIDYPTPTLRYAQYLRLLEFYCHPCLQYTCQNYLLFICIIGAFTVALPYSERSGIVLNYVLIGFKIKD